MVVTWATCVVDVILVKTKWPDSLPPIGTLLYHWRPAFFNLKKKNHNILYYIVYVKVFRNTCKKNTSRHRCSLGSEWYIGRDRHRCDHNNEWVNVSSRMHMFVFQALETGRRVSKEDWMEWLRKLSIELLKESPSPALRSCMALAQTYSPLARWVM